MCHPTDVDLSVGTPGVGEAGSKGTREQGSEAGGIEFAEFGAGRRRTARRVRGWRVSTWGIRRLGQRMGWGGWRFR